MAFLYAWRFFLYAAVLLGIGTSVIVVVYVINGGELEKILYRVSVNSAWKLSKIACWFCWIMLSILLALLSLLLFLSIYVLVSLLDSSLVSPGDFPREGSIIVGRFAKIGESGCC